MKKLLVLIMSICMVMLLMPLPINAEVYNGLSYIISDDDTVTIIPNPDADGDIVIPAEIDGRQVTYINMGAFAWSNITSVEIVSPQTIIGTGAFGSCPNLRRVILPEGLEGVWENAFRGCDSLQSIIIPDNARVGVYMFADCINLNYATVKNVRDNLIHLNAFENCINLRSVEISNGVTWILDGAFNGCTSLTDVYYTGTEDEWNAINIEDNNDPLLNAVIHFNSTMPQQTPPPLITPTPEPTPTPPSGICGENLRWTFEDDTLKITGTGDMTDYNTFATVPWHSLAKNIKSVYIEDGVTRLGACLFSGCSGLTSITIPNSVTSIGWSAFAGCSGLTSISIPDGVTSIDSGAFQSCDNLTDITIPDGITSIGSSTFRNCSNLKSVSIPNA